MIIDEFDSILRQKNSTLDEGIRINILAQKEKAIQSKNEEVANVLWCYERIYEIQKLYIDAYRHLKQAASASDDLIDEYDSEKSKEYETAWNTLDKCDINIGFLERCFCIADSELSIYHIEEILHDIKLLQPLFPYKVFGSRETLVKEQKCSICGKTVTVRHPCEHIPGKLYMGKMCEREITDLKFISENIVSIPFDKYAFFKFPGQRFNFKLLDSLMPSISLYCSWSYTIEKRLLPQYKKVGRNETCPCGSGMKYKHCLQRNPNQHYEDHYKVRIDNNIRDLEKEEDAQA